MAMLTLMKLLHPFTPEDLLISQRLKSSLNLSPATSQFVLALSDHQSPEKIVYVLSVEKLSERSVDDIHRLVGAVNPSLVVAFVDAECLAEIVEEGKLLNSSEGLDVPTSYFGVIKNCFVDKIRASVYETRASLKVLANIFGTTFYGNVSAARKAAEETQAEFAYLRVPLTAANSFSGDDENDAERGFEREAGGNEASSSFGRFRTGFSALIRVNDLDIRSRFLGRGSNLPYFTHRSKDLAFLAPPVQSSVHRTASDISVSSANSAQNRSTVVNELSEGGCPPFAAPFYPVFLDLHQLFTETPGVNQALNFVTKILNSVERGDGVDKEDLARARLFRVAVESVRLCWNSSVRTERRVSSRPADFSQLPFEEKCEALLAHALHVQAQKFGTVVAIVDASNVPGIRRHWNTPVPPEVAAYAEFCFVSLDSQENGKEGISSNILDSPETKAAVVVGAGAVAAAGLFTLPQWASVPTFMKVFSLKVPTVLKLAWIQMKRYAAVSWVTPASNAGMPALKAAGFLPSPAAKSMLLKSASSAEKVRVAAQSVVAAAENASLRAIRTAFYGLMKNIQANNRGPRPWLIFGGSLVVTGGLLFYGDGVEHAIGIVPSAPAVVRLGRGLKKLEQASGIVDDYEGSSWWNRVYETLYRNAQQH